MKRSFVTIRSDLLYAILYYIDISLSLSLESYKDIVTPSRKNTPIKRFTGPRQLEEIKKLKVKLHGRVR